MSQIDLFGILGYFGGGGGDAGDPGKKSLINGYLDEVRFTRGLRYTENFTPPGKSALDNCGTGGGGSGQQNPCVITCSEGPVTYKVDITDSDYATHPYLPYSQYGWLRYFPNMKKGQVFTVKIPKRSDAIAAGIFPAPGSPNSDGVGGSGDGVVRIYFGLTRVATTGDLPDGLDITISYCPGDFENYVPGYKNENTCRVVYDSVAESLVQDIYYAKPGFDGETVFTVSGTQQTIDGFSPAQGCVVDPERDVYINMRWNNVSDVSLDFGGALSFGYNQGILPTVSGNGCIYTQETTEEIEFDICNKANASNTATESVFERLGFNYCGDQIRDYPERAVKAMQSLPPLLPRWAFTDLKTNNVGSYIVNPVAELLGQLGNNFLSLKSSANTSGLGGLEWSANNAYSNTTLFLEHTNRLCGLVEPNPNTAHLPHYDTAMSVGKLVTHLVYQADGYANTATILGSFTSLLIKDDLERMISSTGSLTPNTNNESQTISTIWDIEAFLNERRLHDEGFYANSRGIVCNYEALQRFTRMGSVETYLVNNFLASDKLIERGYGPYDAGPTIEAPCSTQSYQPPPVAPGSRTIVPDKTSVRETETVTYTVTTTNLPNGTILSWTNSGSTDADDFTDGYNGGTVTITNNTGTITRTLVEDLDDLETNETIILQLRELATGNLIATANTVTVVPCIVMYLDANNSTSFPG